MIFIQSFGLGSHPQKRRLSSQLGTGFSATQCLQQWSSQHSFRDGLLQKGVPSLGSCWQTTAGAHQVACHHEQGIPVEFLAVEADGSGITRQQSAGPDGVMNCWTDSVSEALALRWDQDVLHDVKEFPGSSRLDQVASEILPSAAVSTRLESGDSYRSRGFYRA